VFSERVGAVGVQAFIARHGQKFLTRIMGSEEKFCGVRSRALTKL
jgi:hypothetical protein